MSIRPEEPQNLGTASLGNRTETTKQGSVAIGPGAKSTAIKSTAIGAGITANKENTASVNNLEVQGSGVYMDSLPTSDPGVPGQLWNNNNNIVFSGFSGDTGIPEPIIDGYWVRKKLGSVYSWVLQNTYVPKQNLGVVDTHNNTTFTLVNASAYIEIGDTITINPWSVKIVAKEVGSEIRFVGDPANLHDDGESLTNSKIVFTDVNMVVNVFRDAYGKFCWSVTGSTLPVQLTDSNILQIVQNAGFSSYPKPYFNNLTPLSVPPTQSRTITINGAFFKEPVENMLARFVRYSQEPLLDGDGLPIHDETKVIRELQVNSLTFVNDSEMEVNITGVNIHDTATHGTDAYELDGTTEINNVYWLLLHNGATRIFKDTFTVSSGDIYIPKAGLTTDVPAGDWVNVSGSIDVSDNGSIKPIGDNINGEGKYDFMIPSNADFIYEFRITFSEYSEFVSNSRVTGLIVIKDNLDTVIANLDYRQFQSYLTASNGSVDGYDTIISIRRINGYLACYNENGDLCDTGLTNNTDLYFFHNVSRYQFTDIALKILP